MPSDNEVASTGETGIYAGGSAVVADLADLDAHVTDPADAHDASAISYAGSAGLSATDVEAALDELDTEKTSGPDKITVGTTSGPNPYAAGGFVIDLSGTFTDVDHLSLSLLTPGNLPPCHYEYAYNTPDPGKVTVKIMRHRYDRATLGDTSAQNPPAGVTLAGASGATTETEAAHTHTDGTLAVDIDHDHPSFSGGAAQSPSIAPTAGVGGNAADDATHQHVIDVPALGTTSKNVTGATDAGDAHDHVTNVLYEHGHDVTQTPTNAASVEMDAVNLSTTTWSYLAAGS